MPIIDLDGETFAYSIRRSKRAKQVFVKVSPKAGLELVYPAGRRNPPPAEEVLEAKSDWIIASMRRLEEDRAKRFQRRYAEGEAFLVRGLPYRLKLCEVTGLERAQAALNGETLELRLARGNGHDDLDLRRDAVVDFYRDLARAYLPRRLEALARAHGFRYNRLRIKHQKTRWGSCSARRNINLNLRLMMTPDEAIDYVIIHELCHLRELNHSRRFWAHVAGCCPDFAYWRAWLKANQAHLVL